MAGPRDIYGRKPVSRSRGKTHERIMALQHAPGTLPGADELLADCPAGSIGAVIESFLVGWVQQQPVTVRRGYERALVLLLKDFASNGPQPAEPAPVLAGERLLAHLQWRVDNGLDDRTEVVRGSVHLARLADWFDAEAGTALGAFRERLRTRAEELL